MGVWRRWHERRFLLRVATKTVVFGVATLLILFPHPSLILVLFDRLQHLDSLVDPTHPKLAELEAEVRKQMPPNTSARGALPYAEQVVYQFVPYKNDWETRGVMEHIPTVGEVFEKGADDCDGRAVISASLLRRMGYDAHLVTDLLHMWVQTPEGETMSPTSDTHVLVSTPQGTKINLQPSMIVTWARGWSYGVAVFPLPREVGILGLLALVTMQPWSSFWRRVSGVLLFAVGLMLVREQGVAAATRDGDAWSVAAGFACALAGWVVLAWKSRAARELNC